MITPEFLQSCTNEQINKGVTWLEAARLGFKNPCEFMIHRNEIHRDYPWIFSPCDMPNDAWPIMVANEVTVELRKPMQGLSGDDAFINGTYLAYTPDIDVTSYNKNPLRAAMEVYILMSVKS